MVAEPVNEELSAAEDLEQGLVVVIEEVEAAIAMVALLTRSEILVLSSPGGIVDGGEKVDVVIVRGARSPSADDTAGLPNLLTSWPRLRRGSPYAVGLIARKQIWKSGETHPFSVSRGGEPYDEGVILFSRVRVT